MSPIKTYMEYFLIYLVFINTITFCLFALDKQLAKKRARRISEKSLILSAIIGGSLGGILGMYVIQHKTRHLKFKVGMPLILVLQVILFLLIIYR